MPTLSLTATRLCLALTAKHLGPAPTLMDAVTFTSGRHYVWNKWDTLSPEERAPFIALIKHRPSALAHTGRFIALASKVLLAPRSALQASPGTDSPLRLRETDTFFVKDGIDLDGMIEELVALIRRPLPAPTKVSLPDSGPIELRAPQNHGYRRFIIPEAFRDTFDPNPEPLEFQDAPATPVMTWKRADLHELATRLDEEAQQNPDAGLHQLHRESLRKIVQQADSVTADSGTFYRVNAPTGSGKTVVMGLMTLHSAIGGQRVVIAVPTLTDVRNMVEALKAAAAVVAPGLLIAPLHSQLQIAKQGQHYLNHGRDDHPYDYRCLLDVFATDEKKSKRDDEPCFNLMIPGVPGDDGRETSKRLAHCPFLNRCGKQAMLNQALHANIVVVNHHALISSTTRIPLKGCAGGTRSILELLLRTSPLFLIDEIDGLLQSAIDTSVFGLSLSNQGEKSALASLNMEIFHRDSIPDLDDATVFRAQRAATACILNTTRLLMLTREHVEWPHRETTWERADDAFIASTLGIDPDDVDSVCGFGDRPIPPALKEMPDLLRYFSRNDAEPSPESITYDIGVLIQYLATHKLLAKPLDDDGVLRLKSALILRASLHYIEDSLRTLHVDVPLLARAKLSHAMTVQQEMSGSTPFSPTPFGPLQRVVYGFKRKQSGPLGWTLQVVALRGDPHRTLQYLPNLTSEIFAGVPRTFIGFSATAFFPGASCFDLDAKNLIDVPDETGNIRFENVNVTVAVSGSQLHERLTNVRRLGQELWPWVDAKLAALKLDPETKNRARLLLVTGSHDEAEELASTLHECSDHQHVVAWARSGKREDKQKRLPSHHKMTYDDLVDFAKGPYAHVEILVSCIYPMARGHNIVNNDGKSAFGAVAVCVRPMPSSDQPANNLAHIGYTIGQRIIPGDRPGVILIQERTLSNRVLNEIRLSRPTFSQQPEEIRYFTVMNVLVMLTQFVGRARRGGTNVTCYLADAAFFDNSRTWADLLQETIRKLKHDGKWEAFSRHHAGLVEAMNLYIAQPRHRRDEHEASDESVPF